MARPWMPLLLYSLWTTGTAVHLWCMGYATEREFHLYLLTPLIWAASWLAHARAGLFIEGRSFVKPTLAIVPVAVVLLAATATDSEASLPSLRLKRKSRTTSPSGICSTRIVYVTGTPAVPVAGLNVRIATGTEEDTLGVGEVKTGVGAVGVDGA